MVQQARIRQGAVLFASCRSPIAGLNGVEGIASLSFYSRRRRLPSQFLEFFPSALDLVQFSHEQVHYGGLRQCALRS
jgi:hypothetical protein